MSDFSQEIKSLENLRTGIFFLLITVILGIAVLPILASIIYGGLINSPNNPNIALEFARTINIVLYLLVIVVIITIPIIVLAYMNLNRGFAGLKLVSKDVKYGNTAVTLLAVGLAIGIITTIFFYIIFTPLIAKIAGGNVSVYELEPMVGAILAVSFVGLIAFVIELVGIILLVVTFFSLATIYNKPGIRTGAILVLIGYII